MRPTTASPFFSRSWMLALLIGLVFMGLEYGLWLEIEGPGPTTSHSSLDLVLLLCAYLFMFCLKPIQQALQRQLCRRAADKTGA
ncbi:hypothetical protein PspS35_19615 [Pseudomonas sp. S35]|uniref:hypothetical protein n=1 Tax=Pseudomonas sp. S35 TaxID=1573719 RepID=UPI00132F3B02|nr:hypothetical protein [Pseudomonas sp. S35]QHF45891.1 hypothetical protein PspS35_19615 [Pseudomonas sp. S35]